MTRHRFIDPRNMVQVQIKPDPCVSTCLLVLGLPFVAFVLSGSVQYAEAMGLTLSRLTTQPWRLVTSLFWFGTPERVELFQVIGAMAGLWIFGHPLERWWGPWRLSLLVLGGGILGNLAASGASALWWNDVPVGGPGAAAMGPVVAASTVFFKSWFVLPTRGPTRQVRGLSGKHVALFLVAIMLLSLLVDAFAGRSLARYVGYGAAALLAVLLITEGWRPWVLLRRKRIRRLAKDAKVVLFEDHIPKARRQDDKHWN